MEGRFSGTWHGRRSELERRYNFTQRFFFFFLHFCFGNTPWRAFSRLGMAEEFVLLRVRSPEMDSMMMMVMLHCCLVKKKWRDEEVWWSRGCLQVCRLCRGTQTDDDSPPQSSAEPSGAAAVGGMQGGHSFSSAAPFYLSPWPYIECFEKLLSGGSWRAGLEAPRASASMKGIQ